MCSYYYGIGRLQAAVPGLLGSGDLCGAVRTVVWQGAAGDRRPYANLTS